MAVYQPNEPICRSHAGRGRRISGLIGAAAARGAWSIFGFNYAYPVNAYRPNI
jgi:hypothetical protein